MALNSSLNDVTLVGADFKIESVRPTFAFEYSTKVEATPIHDYNVAG